MTDTVLTRLAQLKTMPTPELKKQWRDLFDTEPPPYNRRFLQSRLAYRIQELAYGGLNPKTIERLEALGEELDGGNIAVRKTRTDERLITGTRSNNRPHDLRALRQSGLGHGADQNACR